MGNKPRLKIYAGGLQHPLPSSLWRSDEDRQAKTTGRKRKKKEEDMADNEQLRRYLVRKRSAYMTNSSGGGGLPTAAPVAPQLSGTYAPAQFCPVHSAVAAPVAPTGRPRGAWPLPPPVMVAQTRVEAVRPPALRSHKKLVRSDGGKLPRIPVKRVQFPGNLNASTEPASPPSGDLNARIEQDRNSRDGDYSSQYSFRWRFPMPRYIEHIYEQIDDSEEDSDGTDDSDDDRYNKILNPIDVPNPPDNNARCDAISDGDSKSMGSDVSDDDDDRSTVIVTGGSVVQADNDSVSADGDDDDDNEGSSQASESSSASSLSDSISKLSLIRSLSKGRQRYLETYSNTGWDWDDQPANTKPRVRVTASLPTIRESDYGLAASGSRAKKMASEPKYFRPAPRRDNTGQQQQQQPRSLGPRLSVTHVNDYSFVRRLPAAADRSDVVAEVAKVNSHGDGDSQQHNSHPKQGHRFQAPSNRDGVENSPNNSSSLRNGAATTPTAPGGVAASRFIVLSTSVKRKLLDFVDLTRFSRRNPC